MGIGRMAPVRSVRIGWKRITKTCTRWAFCITAIWLAGAALYVGFNWGKFLEMEPNALGDFLAGTFSPLALFWLVAGYMQQGKALRLNTHEIKLQRRALLLQHKELAAQAKATLEVAAQSARQAVASAAMVELTKEERRVNKMKDVLAVQPKFSFTYLGKIASDIVQFNIFNSGEAAREIKISIGELGACSPDDKSHLAKSEGMNFSLELSNYEMDRDQFFLQVVYTDVDGWVKCQIFKSIDLEVHSVGFQHVGKRSDMDTDSLERINFIQKVISDGGSKES